MLMVTALKSFLALVVVAGAWWSMAVLALSFDTIEAGVRHLNTMPPAREGWFTIVDDHAALCCDDFNTALALSVWLTAISAIPMCLVAIALNRRWDLLRPSKNLRAVLQAAIVFQGASFAMNMLLLYAFLVEVDRFIVEPVVAILFGQALVALFAVPRWFRLQGVLSRRHGLAF